MEGHPSKRRKVGHGKEQTTGDHVLSETGEQASSFGNKEMLAKPKLVLPAHHAFGVHGASRQKIQRIHQSPESSQATPTRIQARQLLGTHVKSVVQPAPETASTVLAIAVDNGQGIVSELDVPIASRSGELTMTKDGTTPTITAPAEDQKGKVKSYPGKVVPPAAVAASSARDQALQTQEAIAKQLNVVPQAPSNIPTQAPPSPIPALSQAAPAPSNAGASEPTAASQSPLTVNTPESHSQQILSSPPGPVLATPPPSAGSSASYFPSPVASISSSSTPQTSAPSVSQSSSPSNPQLSASSNSTMTATASSSSTSAVSLSLSSESSESGVTASALSTLSAASSTSAESLAALTSATHNPSGFETSILSSQTFGPGSSSAQVTPTPNSLTSSASSASSTASSTASVSASPTLQSSSQLASASSVSGDPSSTGIIGGSIGGTSNTAAAPSATSTSGGGSGGSNTPPASVLAGGIVGGVAGATILVLMLVLLFRWRRAKKRQRATISPPIPQTFGPGGVPQPGNMTQRSSTTPFAAAGILGRLRPASAQTATTADTVPSERGFQKISGRKLPSVLASGGDGYGETAATRPSMSGNSAPLGATTGATAGAAAGPSGPQAKSLAPGQGPSAAVASALRPGSPPHSLSGSSFYRDSHGFYGGVVPESTTQAETDTSSSPSTSPSYPAPLNVTGRSPQDRGGPSSRQPEVAITRPGPARTPVINQPGTVPIRTPSRAHQPAPRSPARGTPPPPNTRPFRDGLGRSHPSQDGSRGSRFREDTTPP